MYISRRFLQRKNADILLKLTLNTNQSINLQEKPETYLIILILHVCLLKGINENSIKYFTDDRSIFFFLITLASTYRPHRPIQG